MPRSIRLVPLRWYAVALAGLGSAACGRSELREIPLDGGILRMAIVETAASSAHDGWMFHRIGGLLGPGSLAHWDGTTLTPVMLPATAQANGIAAVGPDHIVVGGVTVYEVEGRAAPVDITAQTSGAARFLVAGRGDGTVYAAGGTVVLRRRAGETAFAQIAPTPGGLREFVVAGTDRLVGIGDGNGTIANTFYHFDGTTWRASNVTRTGQAVSAADENDVWAMPMPNSSGGVPLNVLSWDGTSWSTVNITVTEEQRGTVMPTLTLQGVVALGGGRAGVVVRRDWASAPPYRQILWITGARGTSLSRQTVVKVYCQMDRCTDGGDFAGRPTLAVDGTLFVGPYYGAVPRE